MKITSLKITTFLVLCASFSVMASALLVKENFQRVVTYWGESLQMTVYLKDSSDGSTTQIIQDRLKNDERVDKLEYVSSETALTRFKDQMQSYAPDLVNDKELLKAIPASFQFAMSAKFNPIEQVENMKVLAEQLLQDPQVEDVHYGQDWVSSYSQLFTVLNGIGGVILAILFLGSFFIISNSIRSSIQARRDEIEILELIGATASYIRKPFLIESMLTSVSTAVAGILLSLAVYSFVKESFSSQISFFQVAQFVNFLKPGTIVSILVIAGFTGWLAAMLCLRGMNTGWAAAKKSLGAKL